MATVKYTYRHGMHAYYSAPWLSEVPEEDRHLYGPEEVIIDEVIDTPHGDVIVIRPLGSDTLIETGRNYLSEPWGGECKH